MKKYYTLLLTTLISLISATLTEAQETLYLQQTQSQAQPQFFSNSTQINYNSQTIITQPYYQTVEPNLALIYTRGACVDLKLIPQLETLNIEYTCRSIDDSEPYQELVTLLYDIHLAGSIPLPIVYYRRQVLLNPNLEHIKILTPNSSDF